LRQRGKGAVRTLAELRETPKLAVEDPGRDLRAFTVSLSANAGTRRGKARGSFVTSVLETIDTFYADVVQQIKPWTPRPVKVRDDESQPREARGTSQQANELPASTLNKSMTELAQTSPGE
jgi:hypothetical protein